MKSKRENSGLTGKGGMAFTVFHLCRLGVECVETPERHAAGDLWVQTASGVMIAEVKATTNNFFSFRVGQIEKSDVFFLVDVPRGRIYVTSKETMLRIKAEHPHTAKNPVILLSWLPSDAESDWSVIGLPREKHPIGFQRVDRSLARRDPAAETVIQITAATPVRRVTKRLADGSIRTYTYPRHALS